MSIIDFSQSEFDRAYQFLKSNKTQTLSPVEQPIAYVLGGQPGAGKTTIQNILKEHNINLFVINADEYRPYHPKFNTIQSVYGDDSPKYTQPFINAVTEKLIEDLSNEKYNLIVEGTLRTAEVPISTAQSLKDKGYRTELCVMAVKPEISYESTILRYENAIAFGETPRATSKEHHDMVVDRIAANLDTIHQSGVFDCISIYTRDKGCIYSSDISDKKPSDVEKSILVGEWSAYEKDNLRDIIQQIRMLKQNRRAGDLSDYIKHSESLLKEIGIAYKTNELVKKSDLTIEQVTALSKTTIPFQCQKTSDGKFTILFKQLDLDKINATLSPATTQHKKINSKPKR